MNSSTPPINEYVQEFATPGRKNETIFHDFIHKRILKYHGNIKYAISLHSNCNCIVRPYYKKKFFIPVIFGGRCQCKKKIGLSPTNPWEIRNCGHIYF
jgi:hypothetical protein